MKKLTIREARRSLPHLDRLLTAEGEVTIPRRGKANERIVPITKELGIPSHKNLRSRIPRLRKESQLLVRKDRNGR